MKNSIFSFIAILFLVTSCKQDYQLSKIEGERIEINDSIDSNAEIDQFISPYKKHVDSSLNEVLSYSPKTYSKTDSELNTALGNLFADAVFTQTKDIFFNRSSEQIDFVLLNHGGIRSILSKGDITSRECFELMPFENAVVVIGLKGSQVTELIDYLVKNKRAHPISKNLQIVLNKNDELVSATVNGLNIDEQKIYYVATNDYLMNGGDRMTFFQNRESVHDLNYKIRNVLIDYFKSVDTINPVRDERFIRTLN